MKKIQYRFLWLLPLPLALAIRYGAGCFPQITEAVYSSKIYPALASWGSRIVDGVPFSITLPLLALFAAGMFFLLVKKRFFVCLAIVLGAGALFWGGWGLNYARLPVEETLGLPVRDSTIEELENLCMFLSEEADRAWSEVEEIPDSQEIFDQVSDAYEKAHERWSVIPGGRWGNPKAELGSGLLTRGKIEGITIPFTLEALVNDQIPLLFQPYVACHEAAHLRGFAREEDANFGAYLVCSQWEDPYFQCSAAVNAYIYAYNALYRANTEAAARVAGARSEFLQKTLREHTEFWRPYQQTAAAMVSTAVNDAYLQTVSAEQSAASYGRVVDLLLAWRRMEGEGT